MSAHVLVEFSLGRFVSGVGVVELLLDAVAAVEPLAVEMKPMWLNSCRETFCGVLPVGTWTELRSHILDICEFLHKLARVCYWLLKLVQFLELPVPIVVLVAVEAAAVAVVVVGLLDHWQSCCSTGCCWPPGC